MNAIYRLWVLVLALFTFVRLHLTWAIIRGTRRVLGAHIPTSNDWGTISVDGIEYTEWLEHLSHARTHVRRHLAKKRWATLYDVDRPVAAINYEMQCYAEQVVTIFYPALVTPCLWETPCYEETCDRCMRRERYLAHH